MKLLGRGSFGEVLLASHVKADVTCAVKVIKKAKIQKHEILVQLMHSEMKVLEETVSRFIILRNKGTSTHSQGIRVARGCTALLHSI